MNGEQIRIWKVVIVACLQKHWHGETTVAHW
jgi:hypothetical protein